MIRTEAGMPTARFTRLVGIPERSYRRWQAKARAGCAVRGLWPAPDQDRVEEKLVALADVWPEWGHRRLVDLARLDGMKVSDSTALRALKRTGRVLAPDYTREVRRHAEARRAAFVVPPSGPDQVWQMDCTEYETPWAARGASAGAATTGRRRNSGGTCR